MAKKRNSKDILIWTIIGIILVVYLIWTLFPFAWMFITSIKSRAIIYKPYFIPFLQFQPTLENWYNVLTGGYGPKAFVNSLVVAVLSSLLSLILGALAGYGLSRFKFRRWKNRDIAVFILSQRMMPPVAVIIPYFLIMRTFGLLDTWWALILAHSVFNLPLSTWLAMDFFNEIPIDVEDSALVDGCTYWGTFLRVTLPLSIPGLVAIYILCFIFSWNELLFALTLTYNKAYTVPVLIAGTLAFQQMAWWDLAVYTTLAIIPPVVLALMFEKYLVRGLTLGAVKF
ncbi:MAG: carbohydrate ABC transporter permease [Thaumarchaeota archaeon]|nr:carbohydrate ABC transporter permease [Nitrososphaerota archaeon]